MMGIFIPFATFKKIFNTGENVNFFMIAAKDDVDGVRVEKEIKATLKKYTKYILMTKEQSQDLI